MPVHTQSVISTSIQTYDSVLYGLLTTRENYCYITPDVNNIIAPDTGFSIYSPEFILLNTEILKYISSPRASLASDLFSNVYGYRIFNIMYNTDGSQLLLLDPNSLYSMNGYTSSLSLTAVSHYFDYIKPATPTSTVVPFTNLPLDIATISTADSDEILKIELIQSSMVKVVKSTANRLMLEDIPTTGLSMSKQNFGQWFFGTGDTDLNWAAANITYNLGFTVPSYVI